MSFLANSEGALLLRIGEALGALWDMDYRLLGHTQFRGLLENEVDFDRTWAIRLKNLARSKLDAVKVAMCRNEIPSSTAVEASRDMSVEEQAVWIAAVRAGAMRTKKKTKGAHQGVTIEDPEEVQVVFEATKRARIIRGNNCSDALARQDILDAYRDKADGREIIRKATARREPPPKRPPIDGSTMADPAAEVLGPREVPKDVHDGRRILKRLLYQYRMRTIELGLLYQQVVDDKLYRRWGFHSVEEMVRRRLPLTVRTLQSYRDRALDLQIYPELMEALEGGMDFARVMAVYEVTTEDTVRRWLAVANRTTVMEIRRAVAWAQESPSVLSSYEAAIGETQGAHQWVALRAAKRPEKPPRRIENADPELVEACRWYLANVRIPKQYGFQKVKEREEYVCENPRCYTLTIRCEGHHRLWRWRGGGDEDENARNLCRPCHLRGIHPFEVLRIDVDGKGRDVWSYADGLEIVVS
jgi:hypothetical protein